MDHTTDAIRAWCSYPTARPSLKRIPSVFVQTLVVFFLATLLIVLVDVVGLSLTTLHNWITPFPSFYHFASHCVAYGLYVALTVVSAFPVIQTKLNRLVDISSQFCDGV